MSDSHDFVTDLLTSFAKVLEPLDVAISSPETLTVFLADFGWALDPTATQNSVTSIFVDIKTAVDAVTKAVTDLDNVVSGDDDALAIAVADLVKAIGAIVDAIRQLENRSTQAGWPAPLGDSAFWNSFPLDVFDYLVYRYLRTNLKPVFGLFHFLGILDRQWTTPVETNRVPYLRAVVNWDLIPSSVAKPQTLFPTVYGWGSNFDHGRFSVNLNQLLWAFGAPGDFGPPADPLLLAAYYDPASVYPRDLLQITAHLVARQQVDGQTIASELLDLIVLPIPPAADKTAAPVGIAVFPLATVKAGVTVPIGDIASVTLTGGFESAPIRANIRPDGLTIDTDLTETEVSAEAKLVVSPPTPAILLGNASSSRIELAAAHVSLGAVFSAASQEYKIEVGLDSATLVIDLGKGDGFLQKILGGQPQKLDISTLLGWSSKTGFAFSGQAQLEANIAVHLSIAGVLTIDTIYIAIRASSDGSGASLVAAASGGLAIGPVAATVDRVGLKMDLKPVAKTDPPGNLGSLNLGFGFKPPNGLGLVVDAGPVVGGGYIFLDPEKGQYAGVLELSLSFIEIKAIGILDTKLPDGKPGFSFLIIITTEFTPIQLGFGFTLNGVGGMAGINRTMLTEVLRAGIKTHILDSILFPVDPIKNANKIISDLQAVFPPAEGRYVFGPMVEIGWGDPSLIIAELGIIIEVPEPIRIAILGLLKAALPDPDAAIVIIHLDVLGLIDFGQKKLSMDASLYDSRILAFTLLGDMALRLNWGTDPNFAFSVGGLNPRFQPPPGFPSLHRLTLSLGSGDNPRLSLDTYMALTSNSAQFGAHLEVYANYGFTLHGYLGFDALFIFSPFSFIAEMHASVDLLSGSTVLFSIHLDLVLSGPTPWDIVGSASLQILFFSISIGFHVRFGDETKATLPATDTIAPVTDAFNNLANWSALLPADTERIVSLAKSTDQKVLLLHPMGSLRVDQKVVPLAMQITMFGSAAPANADRFDVKDVQLNGAAETSTPVSDYFAMGQFLQLNDSDKLTAPSYEQRQAGVTLGDPAPKAPAPVDLEVHYETSIIDDVIIPSRPGPIYLMPIGQQRSAIRYGAGALSMVRGTGLPKYTVPGQKSPIANQDPGYVIAGTDDLSIRDDLAAAGGTTRSDAVEILRKHLADHPEDRGLLQVLPRHEVTV